jgi:orotate phosphoribosyltransferase
MAKSGQIGSPGEPRSELLSLLLRLSYAERDVVLASGKRSNFYVDAKQTLLHPDGMALAGTVLVDAWTRMGVAIDAVGGPVMGAVPMTCAFVLQARRRGFSVPGLFVRKEAKGHGTMAYVEGTAALAKGSRVLVLEDTVTTGGSSITSIRHLRDADLRVEAMIGLVDRLEGGREAIEAEGVRVEAIFDRGDFPVGSG